MSDWRTHVRALQRLHPDCFRAALEELMLTGGPPAIQALRAVVAALPDGEKVNLFSSIVNARTMADLVLCLTEPGALQHVQSAALIGLHQALVGIAAEQGRGPLLRAMARDAPMLEAGARGAAFERFRERVARQIRIPEWNPATPTSVIHDEVAVQVRPEARGGRRWRKPPPQFRPDAYGYRSMHDPEAIHASAGAGVACGLPPERGVVVAELLEGVTCSPCRVLSAQRRHADAACAICGGSGFYGPDGTACHCVRGSHGR